MSAYIVSDYHINVLVSYFVSQGSHDGLWCKINDEYTYLTKDNAVEVAMVLFGQNVRSVDVRYNEENDSCLAFRYLPFARDDYSPLQIAGALDCLEYQSCETDDYYQSEAYEITNRMREHLLRNLQEVGQIKTWELQPVAA